jgi:hypothetical protein
MQGSLDQHQEQEDAQNEFALAVSVLCALCLQQSLSGLSEKEQQCDVTEATVSTLCSPLSDTTDCAAPNYESTARQVSPTDRPRGHWGSTDGQH